jgi:hypothetical protein
MPERGAAAEGRPREAAAAAAALEACRKTQMTKRIPLDRLRDVSKQRSIRRPGWSQAPSDRREEDGEVALQVEWPISR